MTHKSQDWPKAVIFDLDGTLIDSAPDIAYALNRAVAKRSLAPFSIEEVKHMIGGGVAKLVERALIARGVSVAELKPIAEDFIAFYRENLVTDTKLYPGALELLVRLRREQRRIGLCTNKQHALTMEILEQLDLAHYFDAVTGAAADRPQKPDAAPLLDTLAAIGVTPDDALMVGDSPADIGCAKAARVRSVAVTFGYSRVKPEDLGADVLISSLADLPEHFAALASSQKAME